jgi:hypothetical protein
MDEEPDELAKILNLFLPEDEQLYNIERRSASELWKYFKGRISYLREMINENVNITYEGQEAGSLLMKQDPSFKIMVFPCEMKDYQLDTYSDLVRRTGREKIYTAAIQAANMVYPDGSFGNEGFRSHTEKYNDFYRWTSSFTRTIRKSNFLDDLSNYSTKFTEIMKIIKEIKGKKVIYQRYKEGGAFPIILLAVYGLDYEFVGNDFLRNFRESTEYCPSNTSINLERFSKKKRIALITSPPELSEANIKHTINFFNSPQNVIGEYCDTLIYTPIGTESVSFLNCETIILDSGWSIVADDQAKFRAIRTNSQAELIELYGKVDVKIYRPCISLQHNILAEDVTDRNRVYNVDLVTFLAAWTKDEINRPFRELYREMAFDGFINRDRNQRFNYDDYSSECDYAKCQYDLYVSSKDKINPMTYKYKMDYSWFMKNPSYDDIETITDFLVSYFKTKNIITITELSQRTSIHQRLVLPALYLMAEQKVTFENRLGFNGFLAFSYLNIALVPQPDSDFDEYLYFENFRFVLAPEDLTSNISDFIIENEREKLVRLLNKRPRDVRNDIIRLTKPEQAELLELSFTSNTEYTRAVINFYHPRLFEYEGLTLSTLDQNQIENTLRNPLQPRSIRVFSDGSWRDATSKEFPIFTAFIVKEIEKRERKGINQQLYGFIIVDDPDNTLYIVKNETGELKNIHKKCEDISITEIPILYYIAGVTPLEVEHLETVDDERAYLEHKKYNIAAIENDDNAIEIVYAFAKSFEETNPKAKDRCKIFFEKFKQDGILYYR